MNGFDRIIGYESVKSELIRISDVLKNGEKYRNLGIKIPRGVLLYGVPGVGKTLMATSLIEESGRKSFVCRKDLPDGDFIKSLTETFEKAKSNSPSIVFLDDMDKYANGDSRHRDTSEYVAIQSCIDALSDCDVFVLATANDIDKLPHSLLRAGRFDRTIRIDVPTGSEAEAIINKYLKDKKIDCELDPKFVARVMAKHSCAELETIINDAGILACYDGVKTITTVHFLNACSNLIFGEAGNTIEEYDEDDDWSKSGNYTIEQVICHEAGHAVIGEILCPGSVTLVGIRKEPMSGVTIYDPIDSILDMKRLRLVESLGGMAALDQLYGTFGEGYNDDIDKAFSIARDIVSENVYNGFSFYSIGYGESDTHKNDVLIVTRAEVEKAYREARKIIAQNKELLMKIIEAMKKKNIITMNDIAKIKKKAA